MCILLDCQCRYVVIVGNVLNPMLLCSVVLRQQYMTFGCLNCSQWWTPPLSSSFPRRGSSTSLRSFVSCTGWRLQSGLHFNNQSSCTSVYTCLLYLTDKLYQVADVEARQRLRSSSSSSLIVSCTQLVTVGDQAFPVATARVWNSLPVKEHLDDVISSSARSMYAIRSCGLMGCRSLPCNRCSVRS